jgi:hypothetical protein
MTLSTTLVDRRSEEKLLASELWDRFSRNRVAFISDARFQLDRWSSDKSVGAEQIKKSRLAIGRSHQLLDRCDKTVARYRLTPPDPKPPQLPKLIGFSIHLQGVTYDAAYSTMSSGCAGGQFISVYSCYGEHSAWIAGIDAASAAEMVLAKLVVTRLAKAQASKPY